MKYFRAWNPACYIPFSCSQFLTDGRLLRIWIFWQDMQLFHAAYVELGVPAESAGHRRPNASVTDPRFERNCCGVFGLHIKCDWDGKPCLGAGVSAAISKPQQGPRTPVQSE
jgi:hypothetical protein